MRLQIQQKNVFSLTLILFIESLSFFLVMPVLYFLTSRSYGFLPADFSNGTRTLIFAGLVFSPLLAKIFTAAIFAGLSDSYGRRRTLLICMISSTLGCIVVIVGILTFSLPLLFLGRVITGAASSAQMIAKAAIADFSQGTQRIKYYSLFYGAGALALLIGPHLGILLTNIHVLGGFVLTTPFWVSLVLVLFNIILLLEFYRDAQEIQSKNYSMTKLRSFTKNYLMKLTFIKIILAVILLYAAWMIYYINMPLYLSTELHYSTQEIGVFMSYFALSMLLGLIVNGLYLSKKFRIAPMIRLCTLFVTIGYILSLIPIPFIQWLAVTIIGVSLSINCAMMTTFIADIYPAHRLGLVLGVVGSGAILACILVAALPSLLSHVFLVLPTIIAVFFSSAGALILWKGINIQQFLSHKVV